MPPQSNVCIPYQEPAGRFSVKGVTAAITGGRFIAPANLERLISDYSNNFQVVTATAAGPAIGVAAHDISVGEVGTCLSNGFIVPVIADGAIAGGARVEVGTAGKAKTIGTGVAVGIAMSPAADGEVAEIKITCG